MKPLVISQPLKKSNILSFVISNVPYHFFSVKGRNQSFGFLVGNTHEKKGGGEGGRGGEVCVCQNILFRVLRDGTEIIQK